LISCLISGWSRARVGRPGAPKQARKTWRGCCDVDAVAVDVALLDDDVTDIDADPEAQPLSFAVKTAMVCWNWIAYCTACTALWNSARRAAPSRPPRGQAEPKMLGKETRTA
jgi:hypothetical protein